MADIRLFFVLIVSCIPLLACTNAELGKGEAEFKQVPAIKEIKPERPVKIKLKKNAGGSYSWELNGHNTDKIIQVDRKLRESLETGPVNSR
jgi:predicted secreted protein